MARAGTRILDSGERFPALGMDTVRTGAGHRIIR